MAKFGARKRCIGKLQVEAGQIVELPESEAKPFVRDGLLVRVKENQSAGDDKESGNGK